MSGTPEMRNLEYDVTIIEPPLETPVCSEAESEMVGRRKTRLQMHRGDKNKPGQTFFELEIRRYRLLQNARLSRRATDGLSWNEKTTLSTQQS